LEEFSLEKTITCIKRCFVAFYKKKFDEFSTNERIVIRIDRMVLIDSSNFVILCHLINFMVSGCILSDRNDQIGILCLLGE